MSQYAIDTTHSDIAFTVRHMMFAKVRGQFNSWKAELDFHPTDVAKSSVHVTVDVASIDTREEKRDAHLCAEDFFAAEKFPKMTFTSSRIEGRDGHYKVVGNLTIRDVTREVVLDVEQTGSGKDPWGNHRLGFQAKTSISRGEFGLQWNQALEAGGVLISDKVDIEAEIQLVGAA